MNELSTVGPIPAMLGTCNLSSESYFELNGTSTSINYTFIGPRRVNDCRFYMYTIKLPGDVTMGGAYDMEAWLLLYSLVNRVT